MSRTSELSYRNRSYSDSENSLYNNYAGSEYSEFNPGSEFERAVLSLARSETSNSRMRLSGGKGESMEMVNLQVDPSDEVTMPKAVSLHPGGNLLPQTRWRPRPEH